MKTLRSASLLLAPLLLAGCEDYGPARTATTEERTADAGHAQAEEVETARRPGAAGRPMEAGAPRPSPGATAPPDVQRATAVLVAVGDSGVRGEVRFEEVAEGVRVTGRIEGLEPGEHGFHVHRYGDLSDLQAGQSAGGHFSPEGSEHGRPAAEERHVGDLGNVTASEEGVATIELVDDVLALDGPHSIVGRAIVVHAEPDRFTQPSGDAGGRLAFGVIGIAADGTDESAEEVSEEPTGPTGPAEDGR